MFLLQKKTYTDNAQLANVQKGKFDDDKSLSHSRESDVGLKFQKDGKNACAIVFGDNVVAVHFESSIRMKMINRSSP